VIVTYIGYSSIWVLGKTLEAASIPDG